MTVIGPQYPQRARHGAKSGEKRLRQHRVVVVPSRGSSSRVHPVSSGRLVMLWGQAPSLAPSKQLVSVEVASRQKPQKTLDWFVRIHGYHFRGSRRQAEGDGEVPMLLVLGSVF